MFELSLSWTLDNSVRVSRREWFTLRSSLVVDSRCCSLACRTDLNMSKTFIMRTCSPASSFQDPGELVSRTDSCISTISCGNFIRNISWSSCCKLPCDEFEEAVSSKGESDTSERVGVVFAAAEMRLAFARSASDTGVSAIAFCILTSGVSGSSAFSAPSEASPSVNRSTSSCFRKQGSSDFLIGFVVSFWSARLRIWDTNASIHCWASSRLSAASCHLALAAWT
mmetsp:Transcript_4072/g.25577  ORF Transcript_4072/g.25577 Transcript_4072/m.25577 type:complete len:225 (+) Transcript_4072:1229-1903(+)